MSKVLRQSYLLVAYAIGLAASYWLAVQLRFDFNPDQEYLKHFNLILLGVVGTKLLLLLIFGQFGSLLSYFGFHDLGKLLAVCAISAAVSLGFWFFPGVEYAPRRAVIVTDFLVSFLFLCGFRLSLRLLRQGYFEINGKTKLHKRIAVIGAGDVGASLVRDFQIRRGLGMTAVAFFDDAPKKAGTTLHGITVQGAPEMLPDYLLHHRIDEVIIAMPSVSARRLKEIITLLNKLHLRFESVPSYEQMLSGKVRVSQIRPVEIQDLLGRSPINLQTDSIREMIQGRVVLVTGAGGTIGGELSRQIASLGPRQLLLVERAEFLLFQIEQELRGAGFGAEIVPLVADVLDQIRIEGILQRFNPQVVFHAAAHKHVPMMEQQPTEAFRNNVIGTKLLAELAVQHRVERFVFISTDKAINPTNVMGATKRIGELYLQALQRFGGGTTKFMAVRFGNVLGSSGSVIPTFKRQISAGGPITVTHPDVTRYFMTVSEAAGLVLQSATLGQGGEIFVLDMGTPMKIVDVARQLIELSGLEPGVDIEIQFTGLRSGEKLFEELNHDTENHAPTAHPKITRFVSEPRPLAPLHETLTQLHRETPDWESDRVKLALKSLVPEYEPQLGAK